MKNILTFAVSGFLAFSIISCNDHEDYDKISEIDKVAIDSVKLVNDTMQINSVQSIITYSNYSSGCEGFYAYDYTRDNFDRYVTTYKFRTDGTCKEPVAQGSRINFQPQQTGSYVFKFWQGKDASDNDIWLEKTVVVE